MSSRMSKAILKNYSMKVTSPVIKNAQNCFISSTTKVRENPKQDFDKLIQISKHLKPLINRPVNEVLSSIDPEYTSASETVTILKVFRMQTLFNKVSPESFKTDTRFLSLCEIFKKSCDTLDFALLASGLRSLLEVGIPADSPCVISAERQILINCSQFTSNVLIRCLHFHHKFLNTSLQKQVVNALEEELIKKLSDVSTPAETLLLSSIYHLFKEDHKKKVELKVIELVPSLNIHEMCKVIVSFAKHSVRNMNILNAIAFHMRLKSEYPDLKETVDLLYAFKKLNYSDVKLIAHLLSKVTEEIPDATQPSLISGLLTTCGYLKWKQLDLLEACTLWMINNLKVCRTREFIAAVLTFASLNYQTLQTKNLLELIEPFLTEKDIGSKTVLLDVAWSLAVLNCIPKDTLLKVLSSSFYENLLDTSDNQTNITNKLKLMNLKGVLKMKHPDHMFHCTLQSEPIKLKESTDVENSRKHVIKILSNFVPMDKCLCVNQANNMGIFIDAEFIMDKTWKPLSLVQFGTLSSESKILPKKARRFALLVLFHKDYTLSSRTLTGINALSVKLLSHIGYSVVRVSYDELLRNTTEVQKAKYLMQKIKDAVENPEKNV